MTSSPLYQPMESIERLGYELRVFIRVPDFGKLPSFYNVCIGVSQPPPQVMAWTESGIEIKIAVWVGKVVSRTLV